jgi:UPF0288 family protein (methanogenesis marker protein 3)
MFDIKKAKEEAEREIAEERVKRAKEKIKAKLREVEAAKKILANHQRELDDLYAELSQDT